MYSQYALQQTIAKTNFGGTLTALYLEFQNKLFKFCLQMPAICMESVYSMHVIVNK